MATFEVKDMTCGHCKSTITKAVLALDPAAEVRIDLLSHRVQIESGSVDVAAFGQAIAEAGYTPVATNANPTIPVLTRGAGGCCCH
ncbi:MAG: heavy-metal-associated domain-containing protein [Steroidobacteraceae bacterium]